MYKFISLTFCILFLNTCLIAQKNHHTDNEAIKEVLKLQQNAWNNGSVDSFMLHY